MPAVASPALAALLPPAAAKALATGNAAIRANANAPSMRRGAIACLLLLDMISLTRTAAAVEHRPAADCDIVAHRALGPIGPRIPSCARACNRRALAPRGTPCPHRRGKSCATT